MLKITIELYPLGFEKNKSTLGEMYIYNDGTGTSTNGNYKYKIFKKNSNKTIWKSGEIKNFNRKTSSAWDLLYLALDDVIANRNKNKF